MATLISPDQARNTAHAVIDVREFPEYTAGAIKGSRLVPLSTVEREAADWNKSEPALLVCRSGKRAAQAAETLERLGFQNVNVLQGGFEAWKAAGLPAHIEENKPWSLERQVRAIAGTLVLLFTLLGLLASPWLLEALCLSARDLSFPESLTFA